jgi:hypothetical protein
MDQREYHMAVGTVLLAASFIFFALPRFLDLDPFVPVMIAIVLVIVSLGVFLMGAPEGKTRNAPGRSRK